MQKGLRSTNMELMTEVERTIREAPEREQIVIALDKAYKLIKEVNCPSFERVKSMALKSLEDAENAIYTNG